MSVFKSEIKELFLIYLSNSVNASNASMVWGKDDSHRVRYNNKEDQMTYPCHDHKYISRNLISNIIHDLLPFTHLFQVFHQHFVVLAILMSNSAGAETEYFGIARSIAWLQMSCVLASQGHRHQWYRLVQGKSLLVFTTKKDFSLRNLFDLIKWKISHNTEVIASIF